MRFHALPWKSSIYRSAWIIPLSPFGIDNDSVLDVKNQRKSTSKCYCLDFRSSSTTNALANTPFGPQSEPKAMVTYVCLAMLSYPQVKIGPFPDRATTCALFFDHDGPTRSCYLILSRRSNRAC